MGTQQSQRGSGGSHGHAGLTFNAADSTGGAVWHHAPAWGSAPPQRRRGAQLSAACQVSAPSAPHLRNLKVEGAAGLQDVFFLPGRVHLARDEQRVQLQHAQGRTHTTYKAMTRGRSKRRDPCYPPGPCSGAAHHDLRLRRRQIPPAVHAPPQPRLRAAQEGRSGAGKAHAETAGRRKQGTS